MHELAVCQALLAQVQQVAADNGARAVDRVVLSIGALSGVEPPLLARAFTIARAGTLAGAAELEIRSAPIRVACRTCGAASEAAPNRLLCASCGDWRVHVTAGEELMLLSIELSGISAPRNQGAEPCAAPAAVR